VTLEVEVVSAIRDVPDKVWASFAEAAPPFLSKAWLVATEEDGPVALEPGWIPHHLLISENQRPVAAVPLYVRDRSDGEFVWHGTMEQTLQRHGMDTVPRGVATLPATPVPSSRLLAEASWRTSRGKRRTLNLLARLGERFGWASTHLQFCEEDEALEADPQVWIHRLSRQARWRRRGAATVDEWLLQYRTKRRTAIRREMKELERQGLKLDWVPGDAAPDRLYARAAELYAGTAERYDTKPRFGPGFFEALSAPPLRKSVLFVTATPEGSDEPVAVATKVVHDGVLYGRLWGAADRIRFLHFNVALYGGIRFCLREGLDRFEPGHGGFHKERRGFPTEPVHSLHRYREPAAHEAFADWSRREWAWEEDRLGESEGESGLR
jgi:hypothetical protein